MANNGDGWPADAIFEQVSSGYTYDDILLMPGFGIDDVDLTSRLSKTISLRTPLVSSPMDTVTGPQMAIAMALHGGIGVLHNNNTVEEQVSDVARVKRFENGFIMDPYVLGPSHRIADVDEICDKFGYSSIPVTENGRMGGKLLGIVTSRDIDFVNDRTARLSEIMTKGSDLVVGYEPTTLQEANKKLQESKVGKLPIVNNDFDLVALLSRNDLKKNRDYPQASKDANKQLLCGAAVNCDNVDEDLKGAQEECLERARALVEAGADVITLDSFQGDSLLQADVVKQLKNAYPAVDIMAGNVVTCRQAKSLLDAGCDSLRVGMSAGSIGHRVDVSAMGRGLR